MDPNHKPNQPERIGGVASRFGRDMRRMVWWAMGIAAAVVIFNLRGEQAEDATPAAIAFHWLFNVLIWTALLAIGAHFARRLKDTRDI